MVICGSFSPITLFLPSFISFLFLISLRLFHVSPSLSPIVNIQLSRVFPLVSQIQSYAPKTPKPSHSPLGCILPFLILTSILSFLSLFISFLITPIMRVQCDLILCEN
uniref:Ovule protein n=1 Tax=Echinococcus granulosus TaxID=6210 RepID=A0A068WM50_ECHGR|nr:hypothetical protein EgrG_000488500 [Echinococcus granulosus]